MAIIDKKTNQYKVDRDEDVFIGLKLPLVLDNGQEASTKKTLEAVKENIFNLCSTELGERVMQPNLGLRLQRYLFEPFSDELIVEIQNSIAESVGFWLPFVQINDIVILMSDASIGDYRHKMEISLNFSLKKDPDTHESVQLQIGE